MQSLGGAVQQPTLNAWQVNIESVAGQLPSMSVPKGCVQCLILCNFFGTTGAGQTGLHLIIRRSSSPGTPVILDSGVLAVAASTFSDWSIFGVDTLIEQASVAYQLDVLGVGMTGAGAMGNCQMAAIFLQ